MLRTYECPTCGIIEVYRRDTSIIDKCPKCGNTIRQKLALNFKLKGGDWASGNAGQLNNGG